MSLFNLKDKAAICGVGNSPYGRKLGRSAIDLAAEALGNAVKDAGINIADIDGMIVSYGTPTGADADTLAQTLGLDLKMYNQTWAHGRFAATCVQQAAMVVASGMANFVVCMAAVSASGVQPGLGKNRRQGGISAAAIEAAREGGGGHGQEPVYGADGMDHGAAMVTRKYFDRYGVTSRDLANVAVAFRRHASMNPNAVRRDPISVDDHQASRLMAAPLRLFDYPQTAVDGAACVIICRADQSQDLPRPPVYISGMQPLPAGRDEFIWTYPGFGVAQQSAQSYDAGTQPVYRMADMDHSAIDALFTYDGFSILVWMALERWGFCKPGEAAAFTADGRIELDGDLPMNTSGGLLSEAHLLGWNHQVEIVRQLRGDCGDRQLNNPEVIQWANAYGDSLIYRR